MTKIAIGTVGLGMNYGLPLNSNIDNSIDEISAKEYLKYCYRRGIQFFDTAPTYGISERLLSESLPRSAKNELITTKFKIDFDKLLSNFDLTFKEIKNDINNSLDILKVDYIQLLQIHNCSLPLLKSKELDLLILEIVNNLPIKKIGVTIYEVEEAEAVLASNNISSLQFPYNLLDQNFEKILPRIKDKGIITIARSTYLKGVLTPRLINLPTEMNFLKDRVLNSLKLLELKLIDLPKIALQFSLSNKFIDYVLLGCTRKEELDLALDTESNYKYDPIFLKKLKGLNCLDRNLTDPRKWKNVN